VKLLVNQCTDKLVFNMEGIIVGIAWLMSRVSPKVFHMFDFPTLQHTYSSVALRLVLPQYTNLALIMCSFYGSKTVDQRHGSWWELRNLQMMCGVRHFP